MSRTKEPVTLDKAAETLGISKDALRKRIQRGSIEAVKDKSGKWQVIIPEGPVSDRTEGPDNPRSRPDKKDDAPDASGQIKALQDQIQFLQQQIERQDHLMMVLLQKIPMIEAPKKVSLWSKIFKKRQLNDH